MLTLYYMGLSNNTLCLIDNGENNLSKILGIGKKKKNQITQFQLLKSFLLCIVPHSMARSQY